MSRHGIRMDDGDAKPMLEYLRGREACGPTQLPLRLEDGRNVTALVYIYSRAR